MRVPLVDPGLARLGWTPYFHQQFLALVGELPWLEGWLPERVVAERRGEFGLAGPHGARRAVLAGRLAASLRDDQRPCVGDFVAATPAAAQDLARIEHVFERASVFRRKAAGTTPRGQPIAANVDVAIALSAFAPDEAGRHALARGVNQRRIERYLRAIADAPARPLVALGKADLRPDAEDVAAELSRELGGVEVHALSAFSGHGIEALASRIEPGLTAVLVGASGVGKSTLTNRLLGRDVQRVEAVREGDIRGRHTTTHRELFVLPNGGLLVDTPGMRELGLFADEDTDVTASGFDDIDELGANCRFRDCRHEDEPGCAVRAAVARGEIPAERLEHSHKLRRELAWQQGRHDAQTRRAGRQQQRALSRSVRAAKHRKRGFE